MWREGERERGRQRERERERERERHLDWRHGGVLSAEDLLVGEEETALVPGTLEVVVGRAVTATAADGGSRISARVTPLQGRREGGRGLNLKIHQREREREKE